MPRMFQAPQPYPDPAVNLFNIANVLRTLVINAPDQCISGTKEHIRLSLAYLGAAAGDSSGVPSEQQPVSQQ